MSFPDSLSIERTTDSVVLVLGNERFLLQARTQMIDILKNYVLKSWKIKEDVLSLNYEQTFNHNKTNLDVLHNTSGVS